MIRTRFRDRVTVQGRRTEGVSSPRMTRMNANGCRLWLSLGLLVATPYATLRVYLPGFACLGELRGSPFCKRVCSTEILLLTCVRLGLGAGLPLVHFWKGRVVSPAVRATNKPARRTLRQHSRSFASFAAGNKNDPCEPPLGSSSQPTGFVVDPGDSGPLNGCMIGRIE